MLPERSGPTLTFGFVPDFGTALDISILSGRTAEGTLFEVGTVPFVRLIGLGLALGVIGFPAKPSFSMSAWTPFGCSA